MFCILVTHCERDPHACAQYNLDAVAFESVLVGLFTIMTGKYCA
eukprot:COSAG06_NODE_1844_length_8232_cov_8.488872_11_plen_43_part_01